MTPKRLAKLHRALTKIALECAWGDLGEARLLSAEFDRERDIVLNGGHRGYLILPKQGTPGEPTVSLNYVLAKRNSDGQPHMGLVVNVLGVHLATDTLNPEPQGQDVPEELASVHTF